MVALIRILFCFFGVVMLVHCIPLDIDVIKDRRELQLALSPGLGVVNNEFPIDAIEELMSKQLGAGLLGGALGGGLGGGGGVGSVIAGSVIGSSLATIVPLLLRPVLAGAATTLVPRLLQSLTPPRNFDAHIVNLPGSKDQYLYLTLAPESTPGASTENNAIRQASLETLSIPYFGTKLGTVNIKAPLNNLNTADSSSGVKQVYEEDDYKR